MPQQRDSLAEYRRKRDFRKTREPRGRGRKVGKHPRFVIQMHDATSLHFDFRLEADGVLKSWAVPKGPSTDPREKRLAMPTEDHPLDYIDFEGVIPQGEYGGGTVMVWDTGLYENITEKRGKIVPLAKALESGHAKVWLEGEKLRGGYALTRVSSGQKPRWLLVKVKDEGADARRKPAKTELESVLTGRTLEEIAAEEG